MPHGSSRSVATPLLSWLLLGSLIVVGIGARVSHLEERVFWVDEVATATRVAGYTRHEIVQELADGAVRSPTDLLHYQQLSGDRTGSDTLNALRHSPEHAPLYFLLTRVWMQIFGSSVAAIRSFSVCLGLLLVPSVAWVGRLLFPGTAAGNWAAGFVLLSPYFVSYAQEARPYSLWALALVLSTGALFQALRHGKWIGWMGYGLTVALCLYTSLLSFPVFVGQGIYVLWHDLWQGQGRSQQMLRAYGLATLLGITLFLPWVAVMVTQWGALEDNTTWARSPLPWPVMLGVWLYSLVILIWDVPIAAVPSVSALGQGAIAAGVLGGMGWAIARLLRTTAPSQWGLLAALALPTPLLLIGLDSLRGGQVSATSRYLFPAQIAILLALAGFLGTHWHTHPRLTRGFAGVGLLLCLVSVGLGLGRSPDYQKARNIHNGAIAALINAAPRPLVLAEPSATFDLLSLSHSLTNAVQIQILSDPESGLEEWLSALTPPASSCATATTPFWFNPSPALRDRLASQANDSSPALIELYQPTLLTEGDLYLSLWQPHPLPPCLP